MRYTSTVGSTTITGGYYCGECAKDLEGWTAAYIVEEGDVLVCSDSCMSSWIRGRELEGHRVALNDYGTSAASSRGRKTTGWATLALRKSTWDVSIILDSRLGIRILTSR